MVDDLAMCYFKRSSDKEPSGWIYLKDIRGVADDEKVIIIVTTQRKIVLEAQTRAEHRLWLQGILDYSPYIADTCDIRSDIHIRSRTRGNTPTVPPSYRLQKGVSQETQFDDEEKYDHRSRTFSRHAEHEDELVSNAATVANSRSSLTALKEMDGREREHNRSIDMNSEDGNGVDVSRYAQKKALTASASRNNVGNGGGSVSSRLHAHISKNNTINHSNSNGDMKQSVDSDVDVDYTSLANDRLEPMRIRMQQLEEAVQA